MLALTWMVDIRSGQSQDNFTCKNQQDALKDWRKGVREGMRKVNNDSGNGVINDDTI